MPASHPDAGRKELDSDGSGAVIKSAGTVGICQDHASFLPETEPRMMGRTPGCSDDWEVGGGGPQCRWRRCFCLIMKPGKAQGWVIQAFTGTTPGRWSLGGVLGDVGGGYTRQARL